MDESVYERAQAATEQATEAAIEAARSSVRLAPPREVDGVRYCLDCDEPVPPARIRAFPAAVRCVECQARRERAPWA